MLKTAPPPAANVELTEAQMALDASIREWRKSQATAVGLPSFFILSDTTIRNIAMAKPRTLDDLRQVRGLDTEKLTRFGSEVLSLCNEAQ